MSTVSAPRLPEQFGRYRIVKMVGEGGMGAVYLARDTQLDRDVALKVPQFNEADSSGLLERFYQEARAAATVQHPNICQIYDVGEIDGIHFLTMAFIDGVPLEKWAVGEKAITARQLAVLIRKVASAMHEAHRKGVVHRDLKPANIMIDRRGEPIVMDFGLARRVQGGDQRLTQAGSIMGSPAYMAPEQVKGDQKLIGPASDVYALGIILYELLTNQLPFTGKDNIAVLAKVLMDEPTPPSKLRPDLDSTLEAICLKAMAKKLENRYASMGDLAAALQDYLRGSPRAPDAKPQSDLGTLPPVKAKTDPPGIRVSQMGGLNSMAKMQAQLPFDRKPEPAPSRRRRKKPTKKGPPIWVWIAGGGAGLAALVVAAILIFQNSDNRQVVQATNADSAPPRRFAANGSDPNPATRPSGPDNSHPIAAQGPGNAAPASMTTDFGMEMVRVPKGKSWLGGGKDSPGQEVAIDYDFYLGRFELTQDEWQRITGKNPSYFSRTGPRSSDVAKLSDAELKRLPVEGVSWEDCQNFVATLNKRYPQKDWIFRLPTVLEWEYACRGGPMTDKTQSAFDFYVPEPTNQLTVKEANCGANLRCTKSVGSYSPNRLGLFDMHGNVWEWCDDQRVNGDRTLCASLGGGYLDQPPRCTPTSHGDAAPTWTDSTRGLRIARVPISQAGSHVTEFMTKASNANDSDAVRKSLDDYIQSTREKIGCSAAVVAIERKGVLIYRQAYGWTDQIRTTPATVNTMFPVNDASMVILRAAIRQLAANKHLDLSESVLKFLKIKPKANVVDPRVWDITIEHLLDGNPGWDDAAIENSKIRARLTVPDKPFVEVVLSFLAVGRLKDQPGGTGKFTRLNLEILEHICMKVSGISALDYYRTKLLNRQARGFGLCGPQAAQSGAVWNAANRVFCTSASGMLQFMRRFSSNGEPWREGAGSAYTWQTPASSSYFLWRSDGITAVVLFNGLRDDATKDLYDRLNKLIDSWNATQR